MSNIKTWVDSMLWFIDNKPEFEENTYYIIKKYETDGKLHCTKDFPAWTRTLVVGRVFKHYITTRKEYRQNGNSYISLDENGEIRPSHTIYTMDARPYSGDEHRDMLNIQMTCYNYNRNVVDNGLIIRFS